MNSHDPQTLIWLKDRLARIDVAAAVKANAAESSEAKNQEELTAAALTLSIVREFLVSNGIYSDVLARHLGLLATLHDQRRAEGYLVPPRGPGGRPPRTANDNAYIARLLGAADFVKEWMKLTQVHADRFVLENSSDHPFEVSESRLRKWREEAAKSERDSVLRWARQETLETLRKACLPPELVAGAVRAMLASASALTPRT